MYTLDDGSIRRQYLKTARTGLITAIGCAAAGAVYEHFSFGVFSYSMLYAFAWPLILVGLPFLLMGSGRKPAYLPELARKVWFAGTAALTTGSFFKGGLEIYGTDSPLTKWYFIAGGVLLMTGTILALIRKIRSSLSAPEEV